jgi:tetratricopeptide (TPR) repeat protein
MPVFRGRLAQFFLRPVPVACLLGLLALTGLGWYLYRDHQFSRELHAARQAEEAFDFDTARERLQACLQLRRKDLTAHFSLARVARRSGDLVTAERELDALEDLHGRGPDEVLEWMMLQAQQGDLADVEPALWSKVKKDHPQGPRMLEALALGYVRAYRMHDARTAAVELLAREPENVIGLVVRGLLLESEGELAQAGKFFQAAVDRQPNYTEAQWRFGRYLVRGYRLQEAREHLEQALTHHPSREARLDLARCYRLLERYDQAMAVLEGLLSEGPLDGPALAEQGRLYLEMKQPAQAEKCLSRAATLLPPNRQVQYDWAVSLKQQSKKGADEHFRTSYQLYEDEKELTRAGHLALLAPTDPEPRYQAGVVCLRMKDDNQALHWFYSALQLAPNHRPTHQALAEHFGRIGDRKREAFHRRRLEGGGARGDK